MTWQGVLQIFVLLAVVTVIGKFLGTYMFKTLEGGRTFMDRVLVPVERGVYRTCGIDPNVEMRWTRYVFALLMVNVVGFVILMILLALQPVLTIFNP
ncbi:MAG: potassium-transporting ATPase subunit KdpA, partial [Acidimicrobiales bacterium]